MGNTVLNVAVENMDGRNDIDTSLWKSGMYSVKIFNSGFSRSFKTRKQ
jgi:hypothetical protein